MPGGKGGGRGYFAYQIACIAEGGRERGDSMGECVSPPPVVPTPDDRLAAFTNECNPPRSPDLNPPQPGISCRPCLVAVLHGPVELNVVSAHSPRPPITARGL